MKDTYFVIAGGGIGEVQTHKDCPTPLTAIKTWCRYQALPETLRKGQYSAPMDAWICTPNIMDAEYNDKGVDFDMVRAFYAWTTANPDRLAEMIATQHIYTDSYLLASIEKKAAWVLTATDEQLTEEFGDEHLHPFSGG